jgi:spermidine/putrescine transport system substrate-binding protein
VTYDTYESNEEMVAKLQAGATGYDIIVPSGYIIPVLVATDLIAPLDKRYLTNWGNVSPIFQNLPSDPGSTHSVPWQWGTSGIAYRADKVKAPVDSWSVFHDARYRAKMTMMDDGREVIGAFLRYRGHSLNSTDPRQLARAKADAIEAKTHLKAYVSAPVKAQLISGDVWISQLWNGDTTQAKAEQPNLEYVIPKEGCTIWGDSMCVPRSAPNKRAAHEWMNYILRPDVGAALSNATGYGTPNAASAKLLKNPVPYPTEEELKRLEYQVDLGRATETWDRIWTEIKSA